MQPRGPSGPRGFIPPINENNKMTTIVYSGPERMIFSDTLVTSTTTNNIANSKADAVVKIEDLTRLKLTPTKGERPLVLGYAGTIVHMEDAARFILRHIGSWTAFEMVMRDSGAGFSHIAGSSVMLVTNKKVYTFEFQRTRVEMNEYPLDGYVCIGSGRRYAETALVVYGATGLQALQAAAICDGSTGRVAMSYRLTRKGVEVTEPQVMTIGEKGALELRRSAGKSKSTLTANHIRHEGKYSNAILKWSRNDRVVKDINGAAERTTKRHQEKRAKVKAEKAAKAAEKKPAPTA